MYSIHRTIQKRKLNHWKDKEKKRFKNVTRRDLIKRKWVMSKKKNKVTTRVANVKKKEEELHITRKSTAV